MRQKRLFAEIILLALVIHVTSLAVPLFFQVTVDKVLVHESFSTLKVLGIAVVGASVGAGLLAYATAPAWLSGAALFTTASGVSFAASKAIEWGISRFSSKSTSAKNITDTKRVTTASLTSPSTSFRMTRNNFMKNRGQFLS